MNIEHINFANEVIGMPPWQPIETCPQDGTWFLANCPSGALAICRPIGPGDAGFEVAYGYEFDEADLPKWWMAIPPLPSHEPDPSKPWTIPHSSL